MTDENRSGKLAAYRFTLWRRRETQGLERHPIDVRGAIQSRTAASMNQVQGRARHLVSVRNGLESGTGHSEVGGSV